VSHPSADSPEVSVTCVGPRLALALARVGADPAMHPAIAAHWLSGTEHARSARFLVDHARADFLAGRVAGKTAVRALVPEAPPPAAWAIMPGENQQPVIARSFPGFAISLAHAGGVGLALVHDLRFRCGIDLERMDRGGGDAIATQVEPAEAEWAQRGGPEMELRWLLLWTAREAQGKSLGTGLLEPERIAPTEAWAPATHGWSARLAGDDSSMVRSVIAGGFVVSLVLPAEVPTDALAAWLAQTLM
jgi:phosphopantetheinyl transferase